MVDGTPESGEKSVSREEGHGGGFAGSRLYLEDLQPGMKFETTGRTITEADIVNFAGLAGDFNRVHVDDVYARGTSFGGRIAHGMLGLTISSGLSAQSEWGLYTAAGTAALLGIDWTFSQPIFAGDTIHVLITIESVRESKGSPDRGVVVCRREVVNQDGDVVQSGKVATLMYKRDP